MSESFGDLTQDARFTIPLRRAVVTLAWCSSRTWISSCTSAPSTAAHYRLAACSADVNAVVMPRPDKVPGLAARTDCSPSSPDAPGQCSATGRAGVEGTPSCRGYVIAGDM